VFLKLLIYIYIQKTKTKKKLERALVLSFFQKYLNPFYMLQLEAARTCIHLEIQCTYGAKAMNKIRQERTLHTSEKKKI
jgi:hypothetical protein